MGLQTGLQIYSAFTNPVWRIHHTSERRFFDHAVWVVEACTTNRVNISDLRHSSSSTFLPQLGRTGGFSWTAQSVEKIMYYCSFHEAVLCPTRPVLKVIISSFKNLLRLFTKMREMGVNETCSIFIKTHCDALRAMAKEQYILYLLHVNPGFSFSFDKLTKYAQILYHHSLHNFFQRDIRTACYWLIIM